MNRRTFLTTIGSIGIASIAGCSSNERTTQEETTITDHSLEIISSDDLSKTEIIKVDDNKIQITGSINVANGCRSIKLSKDPSIINTDPVTTDVSIKSYRKGDDNTMCTQAIKPIMYKLTITYTGPDIQYVDLSLSGVKSKEVKLAVES